MRSQEIFELLLFLVCAGGFVLSLAHMARFRKPRYSVRQLLLFGPMLFITPENFFVDGKRSAPWRALLLWLLSVGVAVAVFSAVTERSA